MTSAARRLRLMLLYLLGVLATVAAVNWIVNPYGAWHTSVVDPRYRVPERPKSEADERLSTAYRVRVEEATTVLVGSSRVLLGMPIEAGGPDGFFNAALSGASLAEIAAVLHLATANPQLKRVVWGVDFYAFEERFVGFRHPETRARLEGNGHRLLMLRIKETLLSMHALGDSRLVLGRAFRGWREPQVRVPWPELRIREGLDARHQPGLDRADEEVLKLQLANWVFCYSDYRLSSPLLALFRETVANLRDAGVEVVVFVPPLSRCELEVIDQVGQWRTFQQWKQQLLTAGPYWDFSGYDKLDRDDAFFIDVPHFKPAAGQVILRTLLGHGCEECGERAQTIRAAGAWVDAGTIDTYLTSQEARRLADGHPQEGCAVVVREMLRARAVANPSTDPAPPAVVAGE